MTCKRLAALTLALLCLTSCASMLEREATYTAPHADDPPASLAGAYRVNTYSGLRSALETYVEEGLTEGSLRFPATYPGNLTVDLEKAKRQLMEEDALGCYALEDVTFHINRIIAYYDVTAAFDYKVDPAEYMTLETVKTSAALAGKMAAALRDFGSGFTVLIDVPAPWETVEDFASNALDMGYNADPSAALGRPALEVTCYPEGRDRAVAKVQLTYPESATVLRLRQRNMLHAAEEFADGVEADAFAIRAALGERCAYDPQGGGTAADVFLSGAASDEGLARAFALVCDLKDMENGGPEMGAEGGWSCTAETKDGSVVFSFLPDEPQAAARAGEEEAP